MKWSIWLSGRTNLPQLSCFTKKNWLFLLIFQMNFRIMLFSSRKKKKKPNPIWDFERDWIQHIS